MIQRYNTESNSQLCQTWPETLKVVADDSKIQYWKQFTTYLHAYSRLHELLLMIQRYNTESNSQPSNRNDLEKHCCCWWFKDTILKAIHNPENPELFEFFVVADDSKIQYWKQFTTSFDESVDKSGLLLMIQRYNTESNSQLNAIHTGFSMCCCWWFKDTILKAIHNFGQSIHGSNQVVADDSKIQYWKQFTTLESVRALQLEVLLMI